MQSILTILEKTLFFSLLLTMESFQEDIEQITITNNGLMQELPVLVMELLEMFVVFNLVKTCLTNIS